MPRTPKLNEEQKRHIVEAIEYKTLTVTELANYYNCHPRTIYRALEEAGMGTAQTDRKMPAGQKALAILKKHGIELEQLDSVLSKVVVYKAAPQPMRTTSSRIAALFHPAPTVGAPA